MKNHFASDSTDVPFTKDKLTAKNGVTESFKIKSSRANFRKQNRGKREFGKELQNREYQESIIKNSKSPSTQASECEDSEKPSIETSSSITQEDPQWVLAYQKKIEDFLRKKEKTHRVDPKYLSLQKDINKKMRGVLVDWLVDVSAKFNLIPMTFFSAVNLLDRYLERKQVKRQKLQLIGITCLMVVSKFEEIYPPSVNDYVRVCDRAYSQEEILDAEADILQVIQFDLAMTPSVVFFFQMKQKLGLSPKAECFGEYLLQTALIETSSLKFSNNELACGAIFLVNKIFKCKKTWETDFKERMSSSTESKVKSCAKELYNILTLVSKSELTAVKRKFSTVTKYEVSKYKIERASKKSSTKGSKQEA